MSGTGDRLHDVRLRPVFHLEKAAIAYIPQIGPAAWAVYCYLVSLSAEGDTSWPDVLTIASACGISTYNAGNSIDTLIRAGLIARHAWSSVDEGPTSVAILPVHLDEDDDEMNLSAERSSGTDRLLAEDTAEEDRWQAETDARNQTRELFSRMLEALDVEPGDLSDTARTTATEASRLARAAGATADDVSEMIDRLRIAQPDLVDDAEQMLEYWNQLFADMSNENDTEPDSD